MASSPDRRSRAPRDTRLASDRGFCPQREAWQPTVELAIAADGVHHYDFGPATLFWLGSSIVSMLLAATLWRVRLRD